MDVNNCLGLWRLTSTGKSIPISYGELCREIGKLFPESLPYRVIEQLELENLIVTLPNGARELTAEGLRRRVPLPDVPAIKDSTATERNWARFYRICHYYADCVHQTEKSQEYLFPDGLNFKWILPALPVHWLTFGQSITVSPSKRQSVVANQFKSRKDDDEDVYIGYPLSAFHGSDRRLLFSPIMLFPVDLIFDKNSFIFSIRQDEIDINQSWLNSAAPKHEQRNLIAGICHSEGEPAGLFDMNLVLTFLENRFRAELNPNFLDYSLSVSQNKILNSAAMFIGSGLRYSKTLKRELLQIAKEPVEVLEQTALAYVFREPPLENTFENRPNYIPLDFIPGAFSNSEQREALDQALNQPVSKVTGPPGTGKSQVAVNLIANLVYAGKSVLFTSKNHKAVHAIAARSADVSPLPLVQFCSTPDGGQGSVWYKQSLDLIRGSCVVESRKLPFDGELSRRKVEDAVDNWRDLGGEIIRIETLRSDLQTANAEVELFKKRLAVPPETLSPELFHTIKHLLAALSYKATAPSWWKNILTFFFSRRRFPDHPEEDLRQLLPGLSLDSNNTETLKKRVERLCADGVNYLESQKKAADLDEKSRHLPAYANLLEKLGAIQQSISENLPSAFIYRRANDILELSDDVMQKLQDAMTRLSRRNLAFLFQSRAKEAIQEAQDAFIQFARVFPAWATTLLSLTKASPCVPGLFDRVIIDEASQCEVPPIIPALFRAKAVTVIGDPAQFPPVMTMRENRHAYLRFIKAKLIDIGDEQFDFLRQNAYGVLRQEPVMLREHFRCHAEIADYFNEQYYGGKLRIRTSTEHLKFPRNAGFRLGVEWKDVRDNLGGEIAEVKSLLENIVRARFSGSIGIITPFRCLAERLKEEAFKISKSLPNFDIINDVNTVNGFQGGERDLIIFVLGITSDLKKGEEWYVEAGQNSFIFNVAASRAKACLLIVGDRERASQSSSSFLRGLARPPRPQSRLSQSPGEEMLYQALRKAGFAPEQQYPLVGRYLDLALVDEKLDIEIDGEAYHLNAYGERKSDDIYRDLQVQSVGWRVCRFWYREVRDDIGACIEKIRVLTNE